MATKKNANNKKISEDRFTASASNIHNVRWAPGYGPKKAKKKGK